MTDAIVNILGSWAVYLVFALGLVLIIKGGDFFVDSAVWIAGASGIPTFIIGATIVSVSTTLPELIVSGIGAANGTDAGTALAIGNAIGSVTANSGLILSLGILFMPAVVDRCEFMPGGLMFLGAILLLFVLSLKGELSVTISLLLFALFFSFVYENIRKAACHKELGKREKPVGQKIFKNVALFLLGTAGIVIGANFLVDSGTVIANDLGIPDRIVGLTMVAIGTSLPELVTTIIAIVKKESSLSVGNILGAGIIDTALILPVCAIIKGGSLPVGTSTLLIDLPVCFAIAAIAVVPTLIFKKLSRWQGITMISVYLGYLVFICV